MNQLVHVHLYRQGAVCRRRGSVDALDEKFDALCSTFAPALPRRSPWHAEEVEGGLAKAGDI